MFKEKLENLRNKFTERANTLFTSMKDDEEDKDYKIDKKEKIKEKIRELGKTKEDDEIEGELSPLVDDRTKKKYDISTEDKKEIRTKVLDNEKESRRADLLYPTMKDKEEKEEKTEKNLDKIDIQKKEETKQKIEQEKLLKKENTEKQTSKSDKINDNLTGGAADIKNKIQDKENSLSINKKNSLSFDSEKNENIAGAEKGKEMSFEEAGNGNVNPKFNPMMTNNYSQNCQSSVAVFEARLRGYDIEVAIPKGVEAIEKLEKFKENPNWAYIDPKTGKNPKFTEINVDNAQECKKTLENNIKIGERYIFGFKFKSHDFEKENIGHIVNVWKKEDGKLIFYDPQASKYYNSEYLEKIKFEFGKFERNEKPKILRVDDKKLNIKLLNILSKKKNQ